MDNKTNELINTIATKLGVASEHVYQVIVRQCVVEGYVYATFCGIILIILSLILLIMIKIFYNRYHTKNSLNETDIYEIFIPIIIGTIITTFVGQGLANNIMKINNPEYYGLQKITELIHGKTTN